MKYDLSKKMTIGANRTLRSLQQSILSLLCEKAFEEISVGDLCEKAMLPRATFYNYFDDKYDLLEYCFITVRNLLDSGNLEIENCEKRMDIFMKNCFDFLDRNEEIVQAILRHNPPNLYLINQLRFFLISNMSEAFKINADAHRFKVPSDMAANLYSQVVLVIMEWKYIDKKECSEIQAENYLKQMVSGITL